MIRDADQYLSPVARKFPKKRVLLYNTLLRLRIRLSLVQNSVGLSTICSVFLFVSFLGHTGFKGV